MEIKKILWKKIESQKATSRRRFCFSASTLTWLLGQFVVGPKDEATSN
jgi:hypothetical protein